eukprot:2096833-Rhodomonas_salina.4
MPRVAFSTRWFQADRRACNHRRSLFPIKLALRDSRALSTHTRSQPGTARTRSAHVLPFSRASQCSDSSRISSRLDARSPRPASRSRSACSAAPSSLADLRPAHAISHEAPGLAYDAAFGLKDPELAYDTASSFGVRTTRKTRRRYLGAASGDDSESLRGLSTSHCSSPTPGIRSESGWVCTATGAACFGEHAPFPSKRAASQAENPGPLRRGTQTRNTTHGSPSRTNGTGPWQVCEQAQPRDRRCTATCKTAAAKFTS